MRRGTFLHGRVPRRTTMAGMPIIFFFSLSQARMTFSGSSFLTTRAGLPATTVLGGDVLRDHGAGPDDGVFPDVYALAHDGGIADPGPALQDDGGAPARGAGAVMDVVPVGIRQVAVVGQHAPVTDGDRGRGADAHRVHDQDVVADADASLDVPHLDRRDVRAVAVSRHDDAVLPDADIGSVDHHVPDAPYMGHVTDARELALEREMVKQERQGQVEKGLDIGKYRLFRVRVKHGSRLPQATGLRSGRNP